MLTSDAFPGSAATNKANLLCPTVLGSPRDTLPCRSGTVTGDARLPRCQQGGSLRQPLFLAIFSCSRSAFSLTVSPRWNSLRPGIGGRRCLSWHLMAVTAAVAGRGGRLPPPCPGKPVRAGRGHWGDWEGTLGEASSSGRAGREPRWGVSRGMWSCPPLQLSARLGTPVLERFAGPTGAPKGGFPFWVPPRDALLWGSWGRATALPPFPPPCHCGPLRMARPRGLGKLRQCRGEGTAGTEAPRPAGSCGEQQDLQLRALWAGRASLVGVPETKH